MASINQLSTLFLLDDRHFYGRSLSENGPLGLGWSVMVYGKNNCPTGGGGKINMNRSPLSFGVSRRFWFLLQFWLPTEFVPPAAFQLSLNHYAKNT